MWSADWVLWWKGWHLFWPMTSPLEEHVCTIKTSIGSFLRLFISLCCSHRHSQVALVDFEELSTWRQSESYRNHSNSSGEMFWVTSFLTASTCGNSAHTRKASFRPDNKHNRCFHFSHIAMRLQSKLNLSTPRVANRIPALMQYIFSRKSVISSIFIEYSTRKLFSAISTWNLLQLEL